MCGSVSDYSLMANPAVDLEILNYSQVVVGG